MSSNTPAPARSAPRRIRTIEADLFTVSPAGRSTSHGGQHDAGETTSPRPVFVIGPLRSGTSLLTLSLSQHPNLLPVLETNWFEQFGMGLQQSFSSGMRFRNRSLLDVAGIEVEDFFAYFGGSIDRLMLDSGTAGRLDGMSPDQNQQSQPGQPSESGGAPIYRPQRWIDGSTSNSFCVFILLRLFPNARFFHVMRDMNDVVDTLTTTETRGIYKAHYLRMPMGRAYRHWLQTTNACIEAEKAFGSNVVMRVRRDDLIASPEATLRRCFDFIDEPFTPLSLRPFSSLTVFDAPPEPVVASTIADEAVRALYEEAEALNARLFAETPSLRDTASGTATRYREDLLRIAVMESDFSTRAKKGKSAIPTSIPGFTKDKPATTAKAKKSPGNRPKKPQKSQPESPSPSLHQAIALVRSVIKRD